ncbi:hypothetical protein [Nonomuraea wenchangensis]|uniref:Uncharacterized protein n=1 Tax=Nonomuraea wenchangensis TaxID=568860 RepID=A0A1I0EZR2_9ACTN|nr:hypothetical protein [Nonomuraea wenchangensis]SET50433.1 hypothetical protein SAMN05421811_103251 [Nonomuraea wenchangensis]
MAATADAAQARAILREDQPLNPAEQAAVDALNERRWVLWHADDYSLGVILLLSRAGLLRDAAQEQHEERSLAVNARLTAEARRADAARISTLDTAIRQACDRLSAGEDPAVVAAWLKEVRARTV